MRYPLTFYTNRFIPESAAGCMRVILLPVIFIRPKYRDDAGLYAHELEHVKQALRGLLIAHLLLYQFSARYKLWAEVAAYRIQAKHYPDDRRPLFARFIAQHYGLDVSEQEALEALRG